MSAKERSLAILRVHRDNLKASKDFEAFKKAHLHFLDWLIADYSADVNKEEADMEFLNNSESIWRWEIHTTGNADTDVKVETPDASTS